MRRTGAAGVACWPGCLAEHGCIHSGAGAGHGAGAAAGRGGRANIRSVSYPACACAAAPAGQPAGSCVLGAGDGCAVFLVGGCLGWMHPPVRSSRITGGRGDLLPAAKPDAAEIGLSGGRCGDIWVPVGSFAHEWGDFPAEKNENFCKKPLSLWAEMV